MEKFKKLVKERISSLKPDQLVAFDEMQRENLLQLCYPCGFGKGYIIITDLLNNIVNNDAARIFAICSHRLGLNDQHASDVFELLKPLIGEIAFAFVGSDGGLNMDELSQKNNYELLRLIYKYNKSNDRKIAPNELTITTTSGDELNAFIRRHYDRKIVIISTYQSLKRLSHPDIDVHTLYCDEAHELASDFANANKDNSFRNNYLSVDSRRKFFFSATPKDCSDDPLNTFLMNNTEIFGRRLDMSHLEAVNKGYVVSTVIKFLKVGDYESGRNQDYGTMRNLAEFIHSAYRDNANELLQVSSRPDLIAPKILIRCSSVEKDMWPLFKILQQTAGNIKLFASASKDSEGAHVYNNIISQNGELLEYDVNNKNFVPWTKAVHRKEYIKALQSLSDNEPAIVLHHDTISEGLNVPGFTGFIALTDKLMTSAKLYQNLSRALRLNTIDKKSLTNGEITVDGDGWIKPCAYLYVPYWSDMSNAAADNTAKWVYDLETKIGAKLANEIPYGDDHATGYKQDSEGSNRKRTDNRKKDINGIIISTFYDRKRNDISAEIENKKRLTPLERVAQFKTLFNAGNS